MNAEIEGVVRALAEHSQLAARTLSTATRAVKDAALLACAAALIEHQTDILSANASDVARALDAGVADSLVDRLRLDPARLAACAEGLRAVAAPAGSGRGRGAGAAHWPTGSRCDSSVSRWVSRDHL